MISPTTTSPTTTSPTELPLWRPLGEPGVGGWLTAVEIDPSEPSRVLLGGDLLGAGVSTNGGETWGAGLGLSSYEIVDLLVTSDGAAWAATLGGPHRSDDGGRTWQVKRSGFPPLSDDTYSAAVSRIVEVPGQPGRLLAFGGVATVWPDRLAGELGTVWESTDAGTSWIRRSAVLPDGNVIAAEPLPQLTGGGFVALVEDVGLFVAGDDATSWTPLDAPLPHASLSALGVAESGTMWVTAIGRAAVASSDDGGSTWEMSSEGLAAGDETELRAIAVGPGDQPVLLVSDANFAAPVVYRSTDSGRTWTAVLDRSTKPDTAFPTAPAMTVLEIDPTNVDRIFAAGSEYVLRSDDGGQTWRDVTSTPLGLGRYAGTGFSGLVASGVDVNPFTAGQLVLTGLDAANLIISGDGGTSWETQRFPDWDRWGGTYDFSFADASTMFVLTGQAGRFGGIGWSTDGGTTFSFAAGSAAGLPERGEQSNLQATAIEALDATTVLATFDGRLYRSVDGGGNWTTIDAPAGAGDLERSSTTPGTLLLSAADGLYRSTDGGSTFELMPGSPAELTSLTYAPDGIIVFGTRWRTGTDDGLWRFDGSSWQLVMAERLAHGVAVDPTDPRRVLLTTEEHPFRDGSTGAGVFFSADGGTTWRALSDGLAMLRAGAVAFDPYVPGRAYLGTEGRGFWVVDL
jgi:hypothetical protein